MIYAAPVFGFTSNSKFYYHGKVLASDTAWKRKE